MPVQQQMLSDLSDNGYRPITISRVDDFIGGCRYVAIRSAPLNPQVIQITPADTRSKWSNFF